MVPSVMFLVMVISRIFQLKDDFNNEDDSTENNH